MPERKASILIVDDEEKLRRYLRKEFERRGYAVADAAGREATLDALAASVVDVVLLDIVMPGTGGMELLAELRRERPELQVIMLTGKATVETAVRAMKLGAFDYLAKPYDLEELELLVERAGAQARLRRENAALRLELSRAVEPRELLGALPEVRALIGRLAAAAAPVLIEGEPGTGKELAARLIHQEGLRPEGPFLVLDGTLDEQPALERELAGDGAAKGLLELADQGTLFIDEVARLPLALQGRLSRWLETGELQPPAGLPPRRSRARLIAASGEDLPAAVRAGRLHRELYGRLGAATLRMPPLRERAEDVPALAAHFLARQRAQRGRGPASFSPEALARLSRYHWPGNVRQLEAVVTRAFLRAEGPAVEASDLFLPRGGDGALEDAASLAAVERSHILKVLAEAGGNRTRAAAALGVDVKTLYNKLKGYRAEP